MKLILASASQNRLSLLKSVGVNPDQIISPNIDETPLKRESSDKLALRLANQKAEAVAAILSEDALIIAADTIVGTKTKVFEKTSTDDEVRKSIEFFSGRRIYIKTAVAVIKIENGVITAKSTKLVIGKVKFKRLSIEEINHYVDSKIGLRVSGGLNIEGYGQVLIKEIFGSHSGIIGLPLYETMNMLKGLGHDPFKSKS